MRRMPTLILSALLLSAGSAGGQDPRQDRPPAVPPGGVAQEYGYGMMGMVMPGNPMMLLAARETLGLTESQVRELESLQARLDPTLQAHMTSMMQAHQQATAVFQGDASDLSQYEASVREAGDRWVEAHLAMASAMMQAREVLTEEQRQQLRVGAGMMRDMMPHMYGGGPGGGGMMHGPRTGPRR